MQINDKTEIKPYLASEQRYDTMTYKRSGNSGVLLPAISLGLWHNFGFVDSIQNGREVLRCAFDLGITHLDLANNYGPPYGSAEENFGTIFKKDFQNHRFSFFKKIQRAAVQASPENITFVLPTIIESKLKTNIPNMM